MLERLFKKYNEMKNEDKSKRTLGFTLIELVIVIVIIAILALILVPGISGYIKKSRVSSAQANLRNIYSSAQIEVEANNTALSDLPTTIGYDDTKYEVVEKKVDEDSEETRLFVITKEKHFDPEITFDGQNFTGVKENGGAE